MYHGRLLTASVGKGVFINNDLKTFQVKMFQKYNQIVFMRNTYEFM